MPLLSCDPMRHIGPETTQESRMEISHKVVPQWDPSRLEVPLGVALPPAANVEEKLLEATTGIVVVDDDDYGDDDDNDWQSLNVCKRLYGYHRLFTSSSAHDQQIKIKFSL